MQKSPFRRSFFLRWLLLLPVFTQAQWNQTNGPYGGDVLSFARDSAGIIYAAADHGGLFFSSDQGASWQRKNDALIDSPITCITVRGKEMYAGSRDGILISADGGDSWKKPEEGYENVFGINCIGLSDSALYAGTNNGLYRSKDQGITWTEIDSGMGDKYISAIAVLGKRVFAGTSTYGIYQSDNAGAKWTRVNIGVSLTGNSVLSLVVRGADLIANLTTAGNLEPDQLSTF